MDEGDEEEADDAGPVSLAVRAASKLAAQAEKRQAVAQYHAQIAAFPVTLGGPPPLAQVGADGMLIGVVVAFVAIVFFTWLGISIHLFRIRRAQLQAQQPVLRGGMGFRAQMHARREQLGRR